MTRTRTHEHESIRLAVDQLGRSRPDFLDRLDSDPESVRAELFLGVYSYLVVSPPPAFRWFPEDRRHDLALDVVMALVEDDFRRLRGYGDRGSRFAAWLLLVANNRAKDVWKRERRIDHREELPEPEPEPGRVATEEMKVDVGRVRSAILEMERRCRLVLLGRLERGWSNKDLCRLFPDAGVDNKVIGNWYRQCRLKLIENLQRLGIRPEDCLDLASGGGEG